MHNLTFKLSWQNIGNIINITHLINLKHAVQTCNGFGKWACHLLHLGVNRTNGSWMNPKFKRHVKPFYFIPTDVKSRYFYQYLDGGLTQGPISLNLVQFHG